MDTIVRVGRNRRGASAGRLALLALLAAAAPGQLDGQQTSPGLRTPDVHFVPTNPAIVRAMLDAARVKDGDLVYDLGCGDGRIVIMAVKRFGARGVCVDIDPARIAESRRNADTAGVAGRISFREADLFATDLREASVVTLYLLPALNLRLRPKLFRELRPGSRIVSNAFDMDKWKADSILEVQTGPAIAGRAYFWIMPADVAGTWKVSPGGDPANGSGGGGYELRLHQRFQEVSGTATVNGRSVPLSDARLRGDRLSFAIRDSLGSDAAQLRFSGRVRSGRMTGEMTTGKGSSRTFSAVRTERGARPELESAGDSGIRE